MNSASADRNPSGQLAHEIDVAVCNAQNLVSIDEARLREVTADVLKGEQVSSAEISLALVDDAAIHEVNRKYLAHDHPTDVISFRFDDADVGVFPTRLEGEVVISCETARRIAEELGCPVAHEVMLYLVHGLLHLCGFDDLSDEDRRQMRRREKWHLQKLAIPAHYES